MKQTLFISFDLIREGEVKKSLAIASILAYLKSDKVLSERMEFHHLSINSLVHGGGAVVADFEQYLSGFNLDRFDFIAISAYIWNEYLLNGFIQRLRILGFNGKIILGGYQISYSNSGDLETMYPDSQFFVNGYAEEALRGLFSLTSWDNNSPLLDASINFAALPSPYLTKEIAVAMDTPMLRLETKRGCPYRCSFCAHRDLTGKKVSKHPLDKVFNEISFITERQVKRVNILDPVFNSGNDYLEIMREINRINRVGTFTMQSRFETIRGEDGRTFLDLCGEGNYHLEFGLQTANVEESENVNRKNRLEHVSGVLDQLKERNISYEVSLIYGLPGQTLDSFKQSIDFVQNKGCEIIKAYPLMLLRGTELYAEKQKWNLKEETIGSFNIPVVTSSESFTREEWEQMDKIAQGLTPHERQ